MNARLGQVFMVIVVMLLSAPLSIIRTRQGRYARVPVAVGIFVVYSLSILGLMIWSLRIPRCSCWHC